VRQLHEHHRNFATIMERKGSIIGLGK